MYFLSLAIDFTLSYFSEDYLRGTLKTDGAGGGERATCLQLPDPLFLAVHHKIFGDERSR